MVFQQQEMVFQIMASNVVVVMVGLPTFVVVSGVAVVLIIAVLCKMASTTDLLLATTVVAGVCSLALAFFVGVGGPDSAKLEKPRCSETYRKCCRGITAYC